MNSKIDLIVWPENALWPAERSSAAHAPASAAEDPPGLEEEVAVLDRGFWAGFTLYPETKMGSERMVGIARKYGSERIMINSSADWGRSDPLSVPKTAPLMLDSGIARSDVEAICFGNALAAFGKDGRMREEELLAAAPRDERLLYMGNSVLRGQTPRVDGAPDSSQHAA